MTNEFKCPFCNGELVGTIGHPICRNQDCVMCDDPMPQDLLEELIRTRKALDVAVDKLKGIKAYYDDSYADPHFVNWHIVAQRLANDAEDSIKAITALEQKDVK